MPSRSSPVIRTMTRHEVDVAVDWAAREGWNPGLADADCFYAADPDGFLIAYLNHEPVACISVIRYDSSFGFLGFYLVKPEVRGRGYGYQIWQPGMERLEGCTVGLDGVVAQQENYRRSGFVLAHRNTRFGGVPQCLEPSDPRLKPIRSEMVGRSQRMIGAFSRHPERGFCIAGSDPNTAREWPLSRTSRFKVTALSERVARGSKLARCLPRLTRWPIFSSAI